MSRAARLEAAAPRIALGCAAALALLLALAGAPVLRGLHAAALAALHVPAGAMLLLLIHALTGGRWGEAQGPRLRAAAAALPAAALLLVPVLVVLSAVFPWAGAAAAVRHPDVARWYLNPPLFALRAVLILALWSALALAARRLSRRAAALGLAAFGLTVSVLAVDLVLSLDPRFKSTAFAMSLSLAFLLAGAAWGALGTKASGRDAADAAKLLAAFALGLLYLDLMQFLVAYDGNLPDKAAWYLRRAHGAYAVLPALAVALAALPPVLLVLRERWRSSAAAVRIAGGLALAGLALRLAWLVLPEWPASPALLLAFALALGLGGSAALCLPRLARSSVLPRRLKERVHGA